eukprot:10211345-Alexandrium_andersonii.AAC.1
MVHHGRATLHRAVSNSSEQFRAVSSSSEQSRAVPRSAQFRAVHFCAVLGSAVLRSSEDSGAVLSSFEQLWAASSSLKQASKLPGRPVGRAQHSIKRHCAASLGILQQ